MESRLNMTIGLFILWMDYWINERNHFSENEFISSLATGTLDLVWLSSTTLFSEQFWREFKLPLKSYKQVSRAYRTEIVFLTFLMTFNFTFFISDTSNAILEGEQLPCRGTSALKCILKINWTYKRCPTLETAAYGNVKIQSLCGNWVKRAFCEGGRS